MKTPRPHPRATGFTLLEVLAVVLVLGIMGGVAALKYIDYSGRARQSSEAAVVAAVRSGLSLYKMNSATTGAPLWPAALDAAVIGSTAGSPEPFFGHVLQQAVTGEWRKGADEFTYLSPTGNTYIYDPASGLFGTQAEIAASVAGGVNDTGGIAGAGGGSGVGSGAGTGVYIPAASYTSMQQWRAGTDTLAGYIGSGYAMNSAGEVWMTDSSNSFVEGARRVALVGHELSQAGTYTLELETELDNYWNQLNYWKVIGVKNGTTLNLTGNTLNWNYDQPGTKTFHSDYAPPALSDGQWHAYSNTFTISAADAAEYDQIVVVMAGSRFPTQTLGWRNVKITGP